jgi:hypothetical protein
MFSWTPYAFVRFLLFFVSGILLGIYFPEVLPENIAEVAFLLFTVGFVCNCIFAIGQYPQSL